MTLNHIQQRWTAREIVLKFLQVIYIVSLVNILHGMDSYIFGIRSSQEKKKM